MVNDDLTLTPIGTVESPLADPAAAPKQGDEGAPDAWLVLEAAVLPGLEGIAAGDRVIVLTWLDRARRDVLRVHPRDDRDETRARGVRHPLRRPPEPDRPARGRDPLDRWRSGAGARARGRRRHPDRRPQAGARPASGRGSLADVDLDCGDLVPTVGTRLPQNDGPALSIAECHLNHAIRALDDSRRHAGGRSARSRRRRSVVDRPAPARAGLASGRRSAPDSRRRVRRAWTAG